MKYLSLFLVFLLSFSVQADQSNRISFPIRFEENLGQWPEQVLFLGKNAKTGYVYFTKEGLHFTNGLILSFKNANKNPEVLGTDVLEAKSNYYLGDSNKWAKDVPNYGSITYLGVYPGIDIVFYPKDQTIEYDFIVKPGVDPSVIQLALSGHDSIGLAPEGDLMLRSAKGDILLKKPFSYQFSISPFSKGGQGGFPTASLKEVESTYDVKSKNLVAFNLGDYDTSLDLVIDPEAVLSASSYIPGSGLDRPLSVAHFDGGNNGTPVIAVAGLTQSSLFEARAYNCSGLTPKATCTAIPVCKWQGNPNNGTCSSQGGYLDTSIGSSLDGFVMIFSEDLKTLYHSTYIGGSGLDVAAVVKFDNNGSLYLAGYTNSSDFPASGGGDSSSQWL